MKRAITNADTTQRHGLEIRGLYWRKLQQQLEYKLELDDIILKCGLSIYSAKGVKMNK